MNVYFVWYLEYYEYEPYTKCYGNPRLYRFKCRVKAILPSDSNVKCLTHHFKKHLYRFDSILNSNGVINRLLFTPIEHTKMADIFVNTDLITHHDYTQSFRRKINTKNFLGLR